jgi:16S rRNA (guanine527-N7)-methyltransferase
MDTSEIQRLLAPYFDAAHPLSSDQLAKLKAYLDLLVKWNAKTNLTAVRDPQEMVTRHFGESLYAATKLASPDDAPQSLIDFGSGAGFPGVPMSIYWPSAKVTLVESQNKKATFLKEVARTLPLPNVNVFSGRAEDLKDACGVKQTADLVTMRAVDKFDSALPVAKSLVAPGGRLALLIGESDAKRIGASILAPIPNSKERVVATLAL